MFTVKKSVFCLLSMSLSLLSASFNYTADVIILIIFFIISEELKNIIAQILLLANPATKDRKIWLNAFKFQNTCINDKQYAGKHSHLADNLPPVAHIWTAYLLVPCPNTLFSWTCIRGTKREFFKIIGSYYFVFLKQQHYIVGLIN